MKAFVVVAIVCFSCTQIGCERAEATTSSMQIGTNIEDITDYAGTWFFIDVFKMSREWMTRTVNTTDWDSGFHDEVPLDENGWPTEIPFKASDRTKQLVHTIVPIFINGRHTLVFYGKGVLEIEGKKFTAAGGRNEYTYDVSNADLTTHRFLQLVVHESDSNDPIRSIRFLFPGFSESQSDTDIFHPLFLEQLRLYTVLRFMDLMRTNDQRSSLWSERTPLNSYTQARKAGASFELLVALANKTGKDPWFCIPHRADDNYVRQVARLLRDTVDKSLKIYVEYSNEVWNSIFEQRDYAEQQGRALGYDLPWQHYYANRIGRIWEIFAEEFGDDSRFLRVIGGQSGNTYHERQILGGLKNSTINPSGVLPEAVAIAPYFGRSYPPNEPVPTKEEIFREVVPETIAQKVSEIKERRQWLRDNSLRLIAYEGGQHFVGVSGAENNAHLTSVLHHANRDPQMYDAYTKYLRALNGPGLMDLFVHFTFASRWSKWGSWGGLEYQSQPIADAPKHRALLDFIGLPARTRLRVIPSLPARESEAKAGSR